MDNHLDQPKLLLFIFGERKTFSFVILFQDAQETLKHWTFVDKTDYNWILVFQCNKLTSLLKNASEL